METAAFSELSTEARNNAELIATVLNSQLIQLGEIANRARIRTMDWEGSVLETLLPDIARIGVVDLALVYPDGATWSAVNGFAGNLSDRDYIRAAFSGAMVMSDTLIDRVSNSMAIMLAAPVFANDLPNAPVIGVLIARRNAREVLDQAIALVRPARQSGYAFMVNREGVFIAHPNQSYVSSMFNPIEAAAGDTSLQTLSDMLTYSFTRESGTGTYTYEGETRICAFREIPGHNGWRLFVAIERNDFERDINETVRIIILVGILCFIAGTIISI